MKLTKGQVIKNYIELCKLIGVKPTKGKGRDYHIAEFERYCKYHKQGQKFIVDEVYPEPLPKVDRRKNNGGHIANTKYEDLMDRFIINLLIEFDGAIDASFADFVIYLDFFTSEYDKLYQMGYKRYAEANNTSKGLVMIYQQKLRNIVKTCLETSLKRLQKNGVIVYEKKILIRNNDFDTEFADAEMKKQIEDTEQEIYDKKKWSPFKRINPGVNRQFKNKVSNELGIMNYWNVYSIELIDKDTKFVDEDLDELKIRIIKSVTKAVRNKESKDKEGNIYRPYSYKKYEEQIDKLTKLLWKLPKNYTTETDIKKLLAGVESEPIYTEVDYNINLDNYNEYYESMQDIQDGIPF